MILIIHSYHVENSLEIKHDVLACLLPNDFLCSVFLLCIILVAHQTAIYSSTLEQKYMHVNI